jgi:hypothetical protein
MSAPTHNNEAAAVDVLAYGIAERSGGPLIGLEFDTDGAARYMANASTEYRNQGLSAPRYVLVKLVDAAAVAELVRHSDTLATAVSNLIAAGTVSDGYSQYVTDVTAALSAFGGAK